MHHFYTVTGLPSYPQSCCNTDIFIGMLQGVQCPYAHGVYERNLHPSKYRTQLCTEGNHCSRHVCFFAHSPFQLRAPTHLWSIEEAVSPLLQAQLLNIYPIEQLWALQILSFHWVQSVEVPRG